MTCIRRRNLEPRGGRCGRRSRNVPARDARMARARTPAAAPGRIQAAATTRPGAVSDRDDERGWRICGVARPSHDSDRSSASPPLRRFRTDPRQLQTRRRTTAPSRRSQEPVAGMRCRLPSASSGCHSSTGPRRCRKETSSDRRDGTRDRAVLRPPSHGVSSMTAGAARRWRIQNEPRPDPRAFRCG